MIVHADAATTHKRPGKASPTAAKPEARATPDAPANPSGSRGSRDLWLDAACDLLMNQGVAGVMILPLSKRLKLSRTSFYRFFADRDELLEAVLERWRDRNTGAIRNQAEAYAETAAEAILNVFDCWVDPNLFDTRFEFAVRSWALQSESVSAEIHAADQQRIGAIGEMFCRFGYGDREADTRARTVYLSQIGYISMQTIEDPAVRMPRIGDYVEIFTGKPPEQRELDRFLRAIGLCPPCRGFNILDCLVMLSV